MISRCIRCSGRACSFPAPSQSQSGSAACGGPRRRRSAPGWTIPLTLAGNCGGPGDGVRNRRNAELFQGGRIPLTPAVQELGEAGGLAVHSAGRCPLFHQTSRWFAPHSFLLSKTPVAAGNPTREPPVPPSPGRFPPSSNRGTPAPWPHNRRHRQGALHRPRSWHCSNPVAS